MKPSQQLLCFLWLFAISRGSGHSVQADVIPPQPVDGKIAWVYDYAEGQRQARASNKPLFVVFRCER
jgi:hypothetical protein